MSDDDVLSKTSSLFSVDKTICNKINSISVLREKLFELLEHIELPQNPTEEKELDLFQKEFNEALDIADTCFEISVARIILFFFIFSI
jgi:hypothetical protein